MNFGWLRIGKLSILWSVAITLVFLAFVVLQIFSLYTDRASFGLYIVIPVIVMLPFICLFLLWRNKCYLKQNLAKPQVRALILILALGFFLDGLSTLTFVELWGIEREANKFLVILAQYIGVTGGIILITLWVVPVFGLLLSRYGINKHVDKIVLFIGSIKILAGVANFLSIFALTYW